MKLVWVWLGPEIIAKWEGWWSMKGEWNGASGFTITLHLGISSSKGFSVPLGGGGGGGATILV